MILVARSTLGTINHTLLSLEAFRRRGLPLAGVVMNGPETPHNRAAIERYGQVDIIAEIPWLDQMTPAALGHRARARPREACTSSFMNDEPKSGRHEQRSLATDVLARDHRHVWHPFTQHGTESEPIAACRRQGRLAVRRRGPRDPRPHLVVVDLHPRPLAPQDSTRRSPSKRAVRACDVRGLHPSASGRSRHGAGQLLPGDLNRVFFSDDGSTAVEVALKIAYQYWINRGERRRRMLIAFDGGYHGDTLGAMSVGRGSQIFSAFRDLMCQVVVLPFPATFEGDDAAEDREAGALSAFEALLADRGDTVAALIIEPLLQGAGGMRVCRPSFLQRLVKMARDAGILVIFDEVATGFGRTGTLFAMEQADVVPDLVCLSKGLTSGYMPMAVTVAREPMFEAFLGEGFDRALPHGHSFTANPLACAVALRSLDAIRARRTRSSGSRGSSRGIATCWPSFRAGEDVMRPRLLGSILAFDLKGGGAYQSAQSRALRRPGSSRTA